MNLIVDSREPIARARAVLAAVEGATGERLPAGDYCLDADGSRLEGWEVKTVGSLLSSIVQGQADGRSVLVAELDALARTYAYTRLVVIGTAYPNENGKLTTGRKEHGWNYLAYVRQLDVVMDYGIPVLQVANEDVFVEWAAARVKALSESHRPAALKPKVRFAPSKAAAAPLQILCSFPGVNQVLAARIWEHYGTVGCALLHLPEWESVAGIGPATQTVIHKVLTRDYKKGGEDGNLAAARPDTA